MRAHVLTKREKTLALVAGILLVILVIAGYLTSNDADASVLTLSPAAVEVSQEISP